MTEITDAELDVLERRLTNLAPLSGLDPAISRRLIKALRACRQERDRLKVVNAEPGWHKRSRAAIAKAQGEQ